MLLSVHDPLHVMSKAPVKIGAVLLWFVGIQGPWESWFNGSFNGDLNGFQPPADILAQSNWNHCQKWQANLEAAATRKV